MDLNDGEVQWLSSHLGHTVKTHKDFYRLQEASIEIGKISKLLLAAENGSLSKYKGKSLEDIQLDGKIIQHMCFKLIYVLPRMSFYDSSLSIVSFLLSIIALTTWWVLTKLGRNDSWVVL